MEGEDGGEEEGETDEVRMEGEDGVVEALVVLRPEREKLSVVRSRTCFRTLLGHVRRQVGCWPLQLPVCRHTRRRGPTSS